MFGFMSGSKSVRGLQASLFAIEASITALKSQNSGTQIQLNNIQATQEKILMAFSDVQASEAVEHTDLQTLIAASQANAAKLVDYSNQIAQLQATIAAGTSVSASDLDSLKAQIDSDAAAASAAAAAVSSSGSTGATGATGAASPPAGGTGGDSPASGNTGP